MNKEGNKLKVVLNKITSVTELVDGNTLVNVSEKMFRSQRCAQISVCDVCDVFQTLTLGNLVYKRTSKRVA